MINAKRVRMAFHIESPQGFMLYVLLEAVIDTAVLSLTYAANVIKAASIGELSNEFCEKEHPDIVSALNSVIRELSEKDRLELQYTIISNMDLNTL